nr:hypothetical protein BaRGS_028202 [Batillaria attramentaria]
MSPESCRLLVGGGECRAQLHSGHKPAELYSPLFLTPGPSTLFRAVWRLFTEVEKKRGTEQITSATPES